MSSRKGKAQYGEDAEPAPASVTLDLTRICIDFESLRDSYEKGFRDFAVKHAALLALTDQEDPLGEYLDRVWPDGSPGTGILANTRPFNHYVLRPPVEGPLADSFAAGSFAPAFSLQERGRGFNVVGFHVTPHIKPRWFERTISGLFVRSWKAQEPRLFERDLRTLFMVAADPGMAEAELQQLRMLPEHRRATQERLQNWGQYLDWKQDLVMRAQIALRYEDCQFVDDKLHFTVRDEPQRRLSGTELMAVALSESSSTAKWVPKNNRGPRGLEVGEVSKVEAKEVKVKGSNAQFLQVIIEPTEELLERLQSIRGRDNAKDKDQKDKDSIELRKDLPEEGFLLSAIVGDLAPLLNQRRGIERLRDSRAFAPRLADYLFDISMALPPGPDQGPDTIVLADRLNARLNQDQLHAVRGALAAPEIFLIQGPPGTGKTTVIAELCYQVARRGGRLLVASQTNLAVDNALARLGNRPDMRPLRLGKAERVGDEFKEFLQENVIERWFRGIRVACEQRWAERETMERQVREADAAVAELLRLAGSAQGIEQAVRPLRQRHADARDEVTAQSDRLAEAQATARSEEALSDALVAAVQWLTEDGAPPGARSLERTQWAADLPKKLARLPGRPEFPEHSATGAAAVDDPSGRLSGALELLVSMQQSLAAVAELAAAAAKAQTLSRGHHGAATEDSGRRLQALLDEHRRLSESEDEDEIRQLVPVNREIKRLRGETWSAACRILADALAKMWGDAPPPEVAEVARSLEPHPRHQAALERLRVWTAEVAAWGAALRDAWQALAADAFAEAEQKVALADQATGEAAAARARVSELEAELRALDEQRTEYEARIEALREPWRDAWSVLASVLPPDQPVAPWPPAAAAIDSRTELLREWRAARASESERHRRWRDIQAEWLQRIRQPSEADRAHLTDLYVAHSNVVGLTCNEAGRWQFYEKPGFRPFDVIIVDEVSKATPPELLLPMLLGRKIILVGDHRQLPPMFREREGSYTEAIDSGELRREDFTRFKKMVTASLFEEMFDKAPEVLKASLMTQYRMHPQVMHAVNYFYAGKLLPGPDAKTLDGLRAHRLTLLDRNRGRLLEPSQHILWIDSSLDEQNKPFYEAQVGSSKVNEWEACTMGRLLYLLDDALREKGYAPKPAHPEVAGRQEIGGTTRDWLGRLLPGASPETLDDILRSEMVWLNGRLTAGADMVRSEDQLRFDPRKPVGVISFYGKQLGRLKSTRDAFYQHLARAERHSVLDIRIDTVDRFQGMERPIVLVSLVRAVEHLQGGDFVRDFRRINVALSRAQGLLMVVGASQTFAQALVELPAADGEPSASKVPVYRQIFEHAARCGGRREARIVPPAPWESKPSAASHHGSMAAAPGENRMRRDERWNKTKGKR